MNTTCMKGISLFVTMTMVAFIGLVAMFALTAQNAFANGLLPRQHH